MPGTKAARKRLAAQRKAYKEYSAEHGLQPHNDRTSVVKMAKGQDTFGDVYKDYGTEKGVDKAENSGIIILDKQFGKKVGKHAKDYGLNANDPEARHFLKEEIKNIYENPDETCYGSWAGQKENVNFFIKGNDVVICKKSGEFITIMKDGVNNERVKNARNK